ncbi:MAG: type I glyceraldehyde-3-phosphate dehydrogenase [Alphaproteobacteria bacterium]|nr:type I glyceraldehyde-3-phosphate dehydrogenase [Alphaproteobacteria bacterium]
MTTKTPIRVAINGFGRIGRMVLRALAESKRTDIQVVAINDLGPLSSNVHLFKYDSVHGRFSGTVTTTESTMDVGFGPIQIFAEPTPEKLPWGDLKIDLVMECSGHFTKRADAARHLAAGAKRVLVSAPADGADLTVVYGVNHQDIKADHWVISNASCTTNCLAPVANVLNQAIGIEYGYMTTIHSYTGDQRLVDTLHSDLRRARAACQSMIPSSTGAAKAVGLVLPELKGKLEGTAIRVPTANVSVVDFKFHAKRNTSIQEINQAIEQAAGGALLGVLGVVREPLVSIDFNHDPHSSSFDTTQTQVVCDRFCRVLAWYDNEWGFSNRMCDVASYIGSL